MYNLEHVSEVLEAFAWGTGLFAAMLITGLIAWAWGKLRGRR